jgi:hypothetical protein
MSMTKEIEQMSVLELCDEIRDAPAYDAEVGLTREQLGSAYERLRLLAVELAEWVMGEQAGSLGHDGEQAGSLGHDTEGGSEA